MTFVRELEIPQTMIARILRDPQPAFAPTGGPNGAGATAEPDAQSRLLEMLGKMDEPAADPTQNPTPSQPESEPETPQQPADDGEPGQNDLPPEEQPQGEDEVPPEGELKDDLSQPEKELAEKFQKLNPDAKAKLLDMVNSIEKGETSIGELKRGHKLTSQIAELQRQIEELKTEAETAATRTGDTSQPPGVAKLKTVQEVDARLDAATDAVRAIEDFLEEHPEGGEIKGKEFTRRQLIERKRELQDEIRQLPKRAQQIQQQTQMAQTQAQARSGFAKDYPWVDDPEHPSTIAVQNRLKTNPWLKNFASPEYVAHVWNLGEKAAQVEAAARKGGGKNGTVPTTPTKPKVPSGKPHAPSSASLPRSNPKADVGAALNRARKEGSQSSLAALIDAAGL